MHDEEPNLFTLNVPLNNIWIWLVINSKIDNKCKAHLIPAELQWMRNSTALSLRYVRQFDVQTLCRAAERLQAELDFLA